MSGEQLVIYLIVAGFALLQFLAGLLKRRREMEAAQQLPTEPVAQEPDVPWWDPGAEAAPPPPPPPVRTPPARAPAVLRPAEAAPERSAARASLRPPAAQAGQASQHRRALKSRAELRRAVELMAILGPPRSRAPDDH